MLVASFTLNTCKGYNRAAEPHDISNGMMHICNGCNSFGIYACPVSALLSDTRNCLLFPLTKEAKLHYPFLQ